ncbi:hypothetical protein LEMLEM_LOCUS8092 [Lemmus lemmus]
MHQEGQGRQEIWGPLWCFPLENGEEN